MKIGDLHKLLARVYRIHRKCSYTRLAQLDVTPGQPRLLDYLIQHDGCIQKDISTDCDLEPATVTNILIGMEKSDLIRRECDPNDRRSMHVYLTEKGMQTHKQVEAVFAQLEGDCFEGFSKDEKELSMQLMQRMYENLKKADGTSLDAKSDQ